MNIKRYANNQQVINTENEIIFTSYDSIIAILKDGELTVGKDWDYSQTTLKYFYKFLNDFYCTDEIDQALTKSNKKLAIEKLIDNGYINYNENL